MRIFCNRRKCSDWGKSFSSKSSPGALLVGSIDWARFPGKIFQSLGGISVLEWVVTRLKSIPGLSGTIGLVTTTRSNDDEPGLLAQLMGIPVYRSPQVGNVAARLSAACDYFGWKPLIRINSDRPFLDYSLLTLGMQAHFSDQFDLVTNLFPRSYPCGINSEIIRNSVLKRYVKNFTNQELEHVTAWFYSHPEQLVIHNTHSEFRYKSSASMTPDIIEDDLRHTTYGNYLMDYNLTYEYLQKNSDLNQCLNRKPTYS